MPLFFNLIFYWMVGLASTTEQFFLNYLINFLIGLCGSSLGLLLGSLAKDPKSVSAMIPLILTPFIMFSGLFKNSANLPSWLGWIQYLSPIKYGLASMALVEVKYRPSLV
jgi:ABC-type multidrug transport system permease subunit